MTGSTWSSISSLYHARADLAAFRIVLRQDEGFDVLDTREFDLALHSKFAIGRASKNQAKGNLLPARHNVYIDSPVVSREHAILTADAASGSPHVYLTDTKSMHGTYVNGTPLVPHEAKRLSNGDKLQFGVNVNRNESTELTDDRRAGYFVAYKYTFSADLVEPEPEPFSRGFTVPEAESEDEELDFIPTGRGSQFNPLVLDDSDAASEPGDEENVEVAEHSEDDVHVTMAHADDEGAIEIINLAEDDDAANVDAGSSSDSESDGASIDSAPAFGLESPLVQEAQHSEEVQVQVHLPATQVEPTSVEHAHPSLVHWMPVDVSEQERAVPNLPFADFESTVSPARPISQSPYADPWAQTETASPENTFAPPLPPRPPQKRQRVWDEAVQEEQIWYGETSFSPSTQDNGTLFHRDFLVAETAPISTAPMAADRMQTPPHTKVVDAAFTPSARGPDVASTEAVDIHPPTPTSINSHKRSADEAFADETDDLIGYNVTMSKAEGPALPQPPPRVDPHDDAVIPTVEEVTIPAERPIAQPKGIFRRALRAAKVMVPATALGAVFTVTALTTLPESFFTVP
ncbi:fha domain protein [Stagonosporopsis vannaccii]|nr:fha domain protein [Stagonosporopsis vannaccii]